MRLSAKRPSCADEARQRIFYKVTEAPKKKRLNAEIEERLYKRIKIQSVEKGQSIYGVSI